MNTEPDESRGSAAKKLDRRAVRSRLVLRKALIDLILEKGYDSITVQDITDRADLNRGTLYLHYRDKHELLLNSSEDVFNELVAKFDPITVDRLTMDIPERHLIMVFDHVTANADFYRVMIGPHGVAAFITRLRLFVTEVGMQRLIALQQIGFETDVPLELVASFSGSAIIGAIGWWLETNMALSPEALAQYTLALTVNGVYKTLGLIPPTFPKSD